MIFLSFLPFHCLLLCYSWFSKLKEGKGLLQRSHNDRCFWVTRLKSRARERAPSASGPGPLPRGGCPCPTLQAAWPWSSACSGPAPRLLHSPLHRGRDTEGGKQAEGDPGRQDSRTVWVKRLKTRIKRLCISFPAGDSPVLEEAPCSRPGMVAGAQAQLRGRPRQAARRAGSRPTPCGGAHDEKGRPMDTGPTGKRADRQRHPEESDGAPGDWAKEGQILKETM